jgi:hypothetical protein
VGTDRTTDRQTDRPTDKESYRGAMLAPNKSKAPTRRELSWGKAIWGPTDLGTDGPTNQPTDQRTKSLIEAIARALKVSTIIRETPTSVREEQRMKKKPVETQPDSQRR